MVTRVCFKTTKNLINMLFDDYSREVLFMNLCIVGFMINKWPFVPSLPSNAKLQFLGKLVGEIFLKTSYGSPTPGPHGGHAHDHLEKANTNTLITKRKKLL